MHKKLLIITAIAANLIVLLPAYCAWEDTMVPLPPGAREIKQEKTQMVGNEFTITIYASELPFAEIARFYRERMAREGWEDILSDEKIKASLQPGFSSQALIFKKDNRMINIQNLPSGNPQETTFSLCRGNSQALGTGEPQVSEVEFKDIPVYPNAIAAPLSSMRTATREQLGYTTSDSAEAVMQFYREKLPFSGWVIQNELPLNEYAGTQADCPACAELPAETIAKIKNSSMKMAALNATRQGKSCYIGATEMSLPEGQGQKTIISISCGR